MKSRLIAAIAILSIAVTACVTTNDPNQKKKEGAAIGAAAGAILGAVIGHQSGDTNTGAILGAVVGGAVGAAVGENKDKQKMDQQQQELEQVKGVEVTRPADDRIDITINNEIMFDVDSSALRPGSVSTLDDVAAVFAKYPDTIIQVAGHADSTGSDEYNQALSERRAQSVSGYLESKGVDSTRIESIGYGESQPRATNDTPEGRQLNRRVEIKVTSKPTEQAQG